MENLIDQYTELRTQYDLEASEMEKQRAVIMAKVQDELDALVLEFQPRLTAASDRFTEIETQIKDIVKSGGKTITGERWQFVYYKGRVTWDTEKLDRYAKDHPEIVLLRNQGEPSVQIRARR